MIGSRRAMKKVVAPTGAGPTAGLRELVMGSRACVYYYCFFLTATLPFLAGNGGAMKKHGNKHIGI